jgi:ABC-type multidrug transport system ATPase subunit
MAHKIVIKFLSHKFKDRTIFSDTGIELTTGNIAAIFGRNGTGKTTLFKILFGALQPDYAEIYLDGELLPKGFKLNSIIGYHTQEIMLPKNLLVHNLIKLYITDGEKQNKLFYAEGINNIEKRAVGKLSLGQQRYLQFLLILNLNHKFILLDEPFSMVEPLYKDLIRGKIKDYQSEKGFLITDHYYLDVLEIADTLNLIKENKICPVLNASDLVTHNYLSNQSMV